MLEHATRPISDAIAHAIRFFDSGKKTMEAGDYEAFLAKSEHEDMEVLFPELNFIEDNKIFPERPSTDGAGIFTLDHGFYGVGLMLEPMTFGMGAKNAATLESMLQEIFREDSYLTVMSFTSPDVYAFTRRARSKIKATSKIAWAVANYMCDFYEKFSTENRTGAAHQFPPHDRKLIITFKTKPDPLQADLQDGLYPSATFIEKLIRTRERMRSAFHEMKMHPEYLSAAEYARFMNTIFNWNSAAKWREKSAEESYNPHKMLRSQFVDPYTSISAEEIKIGLGKTDVLKISEPGYDRYVGVLKTHEYHEYNNHNLANALCGSVWQGEQSQFRCPNIVTTSLYFKDQRSARRRVNWAAKVWELNNRVSSAKDDTDNFKAENDVKAVKEEIKLGGKFCYISTSIAIFADRNSVIQATEDAKLSLEKVIKMESTDGDICHFLSMMPFGGSKIYRSLYGSTYHLATTNGAPWFLPICGDYKGMGDGCVLGMGRTGQISLVDYHLGDEEPNGLVMGSTGAGKSFGVTHNIVISAGSNRIIRLIEEGGSSKRAIEFLGGEYLDLAGRKKFSFNPFLMMKGIEIPLSYTAKDPNEGDAKENTDFANSVEMIIGQIQLMCTPNPDQPLTTNQIAAIRDIVPRLAIEDKEYATISECRKRFAMADQEEVNNLATSLAPFCDQGLYSPFFEGKTGIEWSNRIMGADLNSLDGSKHLKAVVMLSLCMAIINEVRDEAIRGEDKILLLDEAWNLIKDKSMQFFVEKMYRQIRKHNGSIIIATQSVAEIISSPIAAAVLANSFKKFLLWHADMNLNLIKEHKVFGDPESNDTARFLLDWLQSIKTVKGRQATYPYSEFLCHTQGKGVGVIRFTLPKFFGFLYTTDGREVAKINEIVKPLLNQGFSEADAYLVGLDRMGYNKEAPEMALFWEWLKKADQRFEGQSIAL